MCIYYVFYYRMIAAPCVRSVVCAFSRLYSVVDDSEWPWTKSCKNTCLCIMYSSIIMYSL